MNGYEQAKWSRFCGGLLSYIEEYYCQFINTDYEIHLDMCMGDVMKELQSAESMEDLSPQLQTIAKQYESTIK